jgi:hypothetical protein
MEINEQDFRRLQGDVTEIKDALLGTKYSGDGLIKRLHIVECDSKANGEIVQEINRWKSEAQKWKEKTEIQLNFYEQIKWKAFGAMAVLAFLFHLFSKYILQKLGL